MMPTEPADLAGKDDLVDVEAAPTLGLLRESIGYALTELNEVIGNIEDRFGTALRGQGPHIREDDLIGAHEVEKRSAIIRMATPSTVVEWANDTLNEIHRHTAHLRALHARCEL